MPRMIDLTGHKCGRLTVLERAATTGNQAAWLCQCDCGNNVTVVGYDLRSGHTQSCGCLQKEQVGALRKREVLEGGRKRCSACKRLLALPLFSRSRGKPGGRNSRCKLCVKGHPEVKRISEAKRRARKREVHGTFTRADWYAMMKRSPRCHWCKKPFNAARPATHDHVVALSKSGPNSPENSVASCSPCNSRKNDQPFNPVTGQGILI